MSFSTTDLGDLGKLATALGIENGSGGFNSDWLSDPGAYLASALANETQRDALVEFVDEILGGEERETDADGLIWLPIVSHTAPQVSLYLVLDPTPSEYVGIGVGARLTTADPGSFTSLHVPVFRAAKEDGGVDSPFLIGTADGVIRITTDITLGTSPPLGGFALSLHLPTGGNAAPTFGLTLRGLLLPGAAAPRDLALTLDNLDELDDTVLELVLGLLRVQADAIGVGPLQSLVGLIGMSGVGSMPPLPLADLPTVGVPALATWFESVLSLPAARSEWLGHLAGMLDGVVAGEEVTLVVGDATITVGVKVATGSGGHTIVTPTLAVHVAANVSARARIDADLLQLDLATVTATALPRLSAFLHLGQRADGGSRLLSGDPQVDAVRAGLTLDASRRPTLLLAADGVVIAGNSYPTLDLSTPDAVAEVAGTVLGDVVDQLLLLLGPAEPAVRMIAGLSAPPSDPGITLLEIPTFLADPLGAVREYWLALVRDHPSAVPDVLGTVRDLIADASRVANPISGSGTETDPWRIPVIGVVTINAWLTASTTLHIAWATSFIMDTLGNGCTRVETAVAVEIAEIDLAVPRVTLLASADTTLVARARGETRAFIAAGPLTVSADHVGFRARWLPATGFTVDVLAPNLAASISGVSVDVALPVIGADGRVTLAADGWDAVERLLALLAQAVPLDWVARLVEALGWLSAVDEDERPRLRLADLAVSPADAIKSWLAALVLDDEGSLTLALRTLSHGITGSDLATGRWEGTGKEVDPWRVSLLQSDIAPALATWLLPNGPISEISLAPDPVRQWQPGSDGLPPLLLEQALRSEAEVAPDVADLVSGRSAIAQGLAQLAERWIAGDGRVVPPTVTPAGITVHRFGDVERTALGAAVDVDALLGGAPATRVDIAIVANGAPLPWPAAPPDRVIDLRLPGLAPEAFAVPAVSAGQWFVALAGRADARLASGDSDGIAGQAARLERVLFAFAPVGGGVVLVATEGAGHAALAAANALPFVTALVTVGTAFSPVSLTIIDELVAGDTLRMLRWLLPPADDAEPDDADLACGRGLVMGLIELLPMVDPAVELRPPAIPMVPRSGLPVHACYGVLGSEAVHRALTAIVAAGLATRAMTRAAVPRETVTGARAGLFLPLDASSAELAVSGSALLEIAGVDAADPFPAVSTERAVTVRLEIRRPSGWLSGGPNGIDPPPPAELRWLSAKVHIPLGDAGDASAEIVLHESTVFGISRERWIVRADGAGATTDIVTPALPEVRVLLSLVAEAISGAASVPAVAAVRDALVGLGLLDVAGAAIPDGVDHLLHDTAIHLADTVADAARRTQLAAGITQLLTGLPGVTVDLGTGEVRVVTSTTVGAEGLFASSADVVLTAAGTATASFTLGSAGVTAAGGVLVRVDTGPFRVSADWYRAGATTPETFALWPSPDAEGIARVLARVVPAECGRAGIEFLRRLDVTAAGLIDTALDLLGLLGVANVDGRRRVRLPVGLIEDAVGWLRHGTALGGASGIDPTKAIALLDALKPLAGIGGPPGTWILGTGLSIAASPQAGQLRLALSVDTSGFAPPVPAAGRLVAGGTFTLTLRDASSPVPGIDTWVGLAGVSAGRSALHVSLNGGVAAFLRPESGADLPLFPNPPGLGQLAQVVTQALPFVLDALAAETGPGLAGQVGALVRAFGDGLGLRNATPAFEAERLQAWAAEPAAAFFAALAATSPAAMESIADAIRPVLPAGATAAFAASKLTLTVKQLALAWQPAPLSITVSGAFTGLPQVSRIDVSVTLDTAGLEALNVTIGPGDIDAGGVRLRPIVTIAAGDNPAGGRRVELGLSGDTGATSGFAARWSLGSPFVLVTLPEGSSDSEEVALAILEAVLDLVASFAIDTQAVQDLLGNAVGTSTVREVLQGVVLDETDPTILDADLFNPDTLLDRILQLGVNFADTTPSIALDGGLSIGARKDGNDVKLTLDITGRAPVSSGDLVVSIEADSRWIAEQPPAGLALTLLDAGGGNIELAPGFECDGVGIRISRNSGPLLETAVTLGSIAVHLFGKVEADGNLSGGAQLQLSDLAVAVAGAQGGNPVAQGIMNDANSGSTKLAPSFSPALAVQKHGSDSMFISLSAGEGSGPWWLAIQKGFGPVYIEQVGFGVSATQEELQSVSLLLDGRVSLFGLTAAVDDLQLTYVVSPTANVFDPAFWSVDVAGFAINADMAGITLAGGLRKFGDGDSVEYVGMLMARFAVYGLSVYGGYGTGMLDGTRFASFFAFGAINGPIGGPPAFFVTGIGGGLGINRGLTFPADLSTFDQFPFIKALDPAAQPAADPMVELASLRTYFPMRSGEFWFAAGISFTSFALVDGVAVVSVAIGDGLEIALLGLARMALPRPQFPLVSIELGLIARFSTSEGVLWIQAQLTDNSWILHESVRLTGGFAFVTWFGGPNAGQFVLTLGGYHPSFKRDGYPIVPRLGFQWSVSGSITVKGEAYFALTSEAVMAGGALTASADFGAAWATVKFGADGIVYFDPFRYDVTVYARISAGVTIDTWLGDISFSLSKGANIHVLGPEFHGTVSFDVGPVGITVSFGDSNQSGDTYIGWTDFVRKYLEEASPGVARVITAMPGKGALPPGTGPGGATDTATADGSAERPFEVFAEFEITVTTLVPTMTLSLEGVDETHLPSSTLGIAPMNVSGGGSVLELGLVGGGNPLGLRALVKDVQEQGSFPAGVWGPPQPTDDRKVPKGDVIKALQAVRFEAVADFNGTLPTEIAYNQIDPPGPRKPLPFLSSAAARPAFSAEASVVSNLLANDAPGARRTFTLAKVWMAGGGTGKTALAALERERQAPPRLGTLTQGIAAVEMPDAEVRLPARTPPPVADLTVYPPRAIAVLTPTVQAEQAKLRTTVKDRAPARVAPPTMASVQAEVPLAVAARLVRVSAAGATANGTLSATGSVPLTRAARGATAAVAARGSATDGAQRLASLTATIDGAGTGRTSAETLRAGEIAVLQMPNAVRDLDSHARRPRLTILGGAARVVAFTHGGAVLADDEVARGAAVPHETERLVVLALGTRPGATRGLMGWHSGQELPFIGWSSLLAPGAIVQAEGAGVRKRRQRFRSGWLRASELVDASAIVHTRFAEAIRTVAIVLDDHIGTSEARELHFSLRHGKREAGRDGNPLPPIVVSVGNRSVLLYAVGRDSSTRRGEGLTVSVASQRGVHLAGVFGSAERLSAVAELFARSGLDGVIRPLVESTVGQITVGWSAGAVPPSPAPGPPRPPRHTRPHAKAPGPGATSPRAASPAKRRGTRRRK